MQYNKLKFSVLSIISFAFCIGGYAQNNSYWQQEVDYVMDVDIDVKNYQYTGTQKLVYTNNSNDELTRVYYHLFFNAFQPGSEMDMRLQNIADPDGRMVTEDKKSRIATLTENEIGYLHVQSLTQDGVKVSFNEEETILVVELAKPIPPGGKTTFDMTFNGQIPVQIRRAGRNNKDGVALSMSQWYPKLAEYDFEGWHADPYIAREFHGVWGDFDVKLTLDKTYTVGGTGYLQNPQEIGHGYETPGSKIKKQKGKTLTWHFKAPKVHDFMWAADPEYVHDTVQMNDGPTLHFLYKDDEKFQKTWKAVQPLTEKAMNFFSKNIGKYPYDQYSVIQGGDGGMEYAMATLITGGDKPGSVIGTMIHELAHSWFQHVLATNESKYEWMDEGFTTFISSLCSNEIREQNKDNPFESSYKGYYYLIKTGKEQPQTTHSDRYNENMPYSIAAYSKGSIFLSQLGYIIGQDKLMKSIQKYFEDFKFKHPIPNDIKRSAEKVSGIELDWYLTDWTQTTNTIDYAISDVLADGAKTKVNMSRIGQMPMPIDVLVVYKDGSQETFYAPLRMMRGEKTNPYPQFERTVLPDWPWANPSYSFEINKPQTDIKAIVIDPSQLMADINAENNVWQSE
ncbi:M1 family metallopeptidase [Aurantibacter sp.]|uniref:M1 family metallopeptidase n=1 Tax=Aurantibacter sp. TaxID=2807103 RepID=UPI0032638D61